MFQIAPDEDLPLRICQPCVDRLNTSYDFRIQCENSDLNLRNKLYKSEKCPNNLFVKVEDISQLIYDPPIKCELEDSGFNNESPVSNYEVKKSDCSNVIEKLNNRKNTKRKTSSRKKESAKKRKCKLSSSDNDDIDIYEALDFAANDENFLQEEKPPKTKNTASNKISNKPVKEQCFTCGKVMSSR